MILPSSVCETDDRLCDYILTSTGNEWLAGAANWLVAKPLAVVGLLAFGFAIRWVAGRVIDRLASRAAEGLVPERFANVAAEDRSDGEPARGRTVRSPSTLAAVAARRVQRARTIASVLKSITTFVIFTVVTIMVISEVGYDVGPLIAGAGIVGVALGFGAQNLVKDFLSGVFLAFEDQLGVGDRIEVNEVTGTVEALTLRVTRLRDEEGTIWYVRNGEILKVGNHSQG